MINPILETVRKRIDAEGITITAASAAIGVGVASMTRHLAGEYVRSDSLAKYRLWLNGGRLREEQPSQVFENPVGAPEMNGAEQLFGISAQSSGSKRPRYVVDLFCGCGGMSLGFERFGSGKTFQIAMALDIEEPMVRVFNDNHPSPSGNLPIARRSDIAEFMNEAEIIAFYLDHLGRTTGDHKLTSALMSLGEFSLGSFRRSLQEIDSKFQARLMSVRGESDYVEAIRAAGSNALSQTSVIGFHNATKLPLTGTSFPKLGPVIWSDSTLPPDEGMKYAVIKPDAKLIKTSIARANKLWTGEVNKLVSRAEGSGRGQLAGAAERINRFIGLLDTDAMRLVRDLWIDWRASREAVRITFLDDPVVNERLRKIYEDGHQVSVLLGGPPCQGFSRIGRGKIRSLREQSLHVQEDGDSVDSRNQLMHQYVLFVSAFAPEVFLFENVRHFQAVVKSDGVEFDAADILAESIEAVSARGLGYMVAKDIVVASKHAVPQARERFVMSGVRRDLDGAFSGFNAAAWCLSLQTRESVPLLTALEGLPEPYFVNQPEVSMASKVKGQSPPLSGLTNAADVYRSWIYRNGPVDAHLARPPRKDDGSFFALMGPGKRWMDYRCDEAATLALLSNVINILNASLASNAGLAKKIGLNALEVSTLAERMDGSLSLRLLLESIAPVLGEEQHHLLAQNYLQKREGAHGDWLARMSGSQPSKTIVSHMAKDTYAYVHPTVARTLSVREAARVQSFPDDYRFGSVGLVDGFKVVGNAVPPLLSLQFAERVAQVLSRVDASLLTETKISA